MTEAFCNLLSHKVFRDAFLKKLELGDLIDSIQFEDFDTQSRIGDQGQPDLLIRNNHLAAFIEIKTGNSCLTSNQPTGYLNFLSKSESTKKYLIFLIPKGYIYFKSWEELVEAWGKVNSSTIINETIRWEDVIEIIRSLELDKLNPIFSDFLAILKSWYLIEPVSFSNQEVETMYSEKIPEILEKLEQTINETIAMAKKENINTQVGKNREEYGVTFLNKSGAKFLYFGVWYSYWKKYKKPLYYFVGENWASVKSFKNIFPNADLLKKMEGYTSILPGYFQGLEKNEFSSLENSTEIAEKVIKLAKDLMDEK